MDLNYLFIKKPFKSRANMLDRRLGNTRGVSKLWYSDSLTLNSLRFVGIDILFKKSVKLIIV